MEIKGQKMLFKIFLCAAVLFATLTRASLVIAKEASNNSSIQFNKTPSEKEIEIVNSLYGDFLKTNRNIKIETSLIDLQGNGVGSLFVKFVSNETCADTRCDVVILSYRQGKWVSIFEHSANNIIILPPDNNFPNENMKSIMIEGVEWVWSGFDHYLPNIKSMGQPFPQKERASVNIASQAQMALKNSLINLPEPPVFFKREINLNTSDMIATPFFWVTAQGKGLCGISIGCPHVILMGTSKGLVPIWRGFSPGFGVILSSIHNGLKDVAIGVKDGYEVLAYDGQTYQVIETSFPSKITPAP